VSSSESSTSDSSSNTFSVTIDDLRGDKQIKAKAQKRLERFLN
jgi:hypothetical protein